MYEGRGDVFVSATAKDWNQSCIGIGFLGKFIEKLPSHEALDVCKSFLQYLVDKGMWLLCVTVKKMLSSSHNMLNWEFLLLIERDINNSICSDPNSIC